MKPDLRLLQALSETRDHHLRLADNLKEQIHEHIRSLPPDTDKTAIHHATGLSRTTVYKLLPKPAPTKPRAEEKPHKTGDGKTRDA